MKFFKYQSLGNDFVLIDAIAHQQLWSAFKKNDIKCICHRHFGIGADGVLVIRRISKNENVQCKIFNSDGSEAELCINGIRCIAHFLFTQYHFPIQFVLNMTQRSILCDIKKQNSANIHIILNTGKAESYEKKVIHLSNQPITGNFIQFSNPHFVIFKEISDKDLLFEGESISKHSHFPHQTNVAYVSQTDLKKNSYDLSFYERGVGMTLSCGSGVSAVMWALYQHNKINQSTYVTLKMRGGTMQSYLDKHNNIIQEANVTLVFVGDYNV